MSWFNLRNPGSPFSSSMRCIFSKSPIAPICDAPRSMRTCAVSAKAPAPKQNACVYITPSEVAMIDYSGDGLLGHDTKGKAFKGQVR